MDGVKNNHIQSLSVSQSKHSDDSKQIKAGLDVQLLNNLQKSTDCFGISLQAIRKSLPAGEHAYIDEIKLNNPEGDKLFLVRGSPELTCVIHTDKFGLNPLLLDKNIANFIVNNHGIKGGQSLLLTGLGLSGMFVIAKFALKKIKYQNAAPADIVNSKKLLPNNYQPEASRIEAAINTFRDLEMQKKLTSKI